MHLLMSPDLFLKSTFLKNKVGKQSVSNGLDPDQGRHSVCPDLGPNCLQRLSLVRFVLIQIQ